VTEELSEILEALVSLPEWEWPRGARNAIREGLRDDGVKARLLAVQLAGRDLDPVVSDELMRLLKDDADDDVRAEAAIAFGPALEECATEARHFGFDEESPLSAPQFHEVLRTLESIYRSAGAGTRVRRKALEAAVRADEPWVEGATRAAYRSGDPAWRTTALFCMGYLDGFDGEILEGLDDRDLAVRRGPSAPPAAPG